MYLVLIKHINKNLKMSLSRYFLGWILPIYDLLPHTSHISVRKGQVCHIIRVNVTL